jgi:hypothetical protein
VPTAATLRSSYHGASMPVGAAGWNSVALLASVGLDVVTVEREK